MKLSIKQKILEKALAHSSGIIEKKQVVPILGYVLFSAAKGKGLTITSTNMDITVIDNISCNVFEDGEYCLPSGLLYDITKKINSNSEIVFEYIQSENSIKISSDRANFSIHYMEKENFPPIANAEYSVVFPIKSKIFKKALDVTKVAMLQDNARFHLNGIHMHHENEFGINKLRFVATDLFRIACVSIAAPSDAQNMPPIIISKKTVGEMLRLIDGNESEDVVVAVADNRISFKTESAEIKTEFSSRLINGTFPEYKSALNVSNDKLLTLNTTEIVNGLDRVRTIVFDSTSSVKLSISKNKLILSGVSRELGKATEEIDVIFDSPSPMEICFNSKYLLEILKEIKTPEIKMLLAESNSSTIITPTNNAEASDLEMTFAVMPIEIIKT